MARSTRSGAKPQLNNREITVCREVFHSHVEENASTTFDLKIMLSELGQYPSEDELICLLQLHNGKINFNTFCKYMEYLKYKFITPEPTDIDTVRAFAALGGGLDRTGEVLTDYLRDTCKHFELRIDIDQMILEVDQDGSGAISFDEFKAMWDHSVLDEDDSKKTAKSRPPSAAVNQMAASNEEQADTVMTDAQCIEQQLNKFFFPSTVAPPASKSAGALTSSREKHTPTTSSSLPTLPLVKLQKPPRTAMSKDAVVDKNSPRGAVPPGSGRVQCVIISSSPRPRGVSRGRSRGKF